MSFLSFFHSIGHALTSPKTAAATDLAGVAVAGFNPGLGALIEMIANAAYTIETQNPGTAGSDKKDKAKQLIDVAAPVAVSVLSAVAGKPVADASTVAPQIDTLIDTTVSLFNTLGVFTHNSSSAAPAGPAAPAATADSSEPVIPAGVPSAHLS